MAGYPIGVQVSAVMRAERQPNYVDRPRFVTAEALVRRGYASWHNRATGEIRLTLAGLRLARFGER